MHPLGPEVPRHLYAYPLYVCRVLTQLFLVDLPVLTRGTSIRATLRALRVHYTDVYRHPHAHAPATLRALPARMRSETDALCAAVPPHVLEDVLAQHVGPAFARGLAQRAAWQAVRGAGGRKKSLDPDAADEHLAFLAAQRVAFADACARRSTPALRAALDPAARAALGLARAAPSAAQWTWLAALAALLDPEMVVRTADVTPAALCLRAAQDVEGALHGAGVIAAARTAARVARYRARFDASAAEVARKLF